MCRIASTFAMGTILCMTISAVSLVGCRKSQEPDLRDKGKPEPIFAGAPKIDAVPKVTAKLVYDEGKEKTLAAQRETHRKKMAAVEREYIPVLAKLPRFDSDDDSWLARIGTENVGSSAMFARDQPVLALGGWDKCEVWNLKKGKLIFSVKANAGKAVAISSDGKSLATLDRIERFVELWDVSTGLRRAKLARGGYTRGMHVLPDGKTLITATSIYSEVNPLVEFRISRWNMTTGRLLDAKRVQRWQHGHGPEAAAFSADGSRVAEAIFGRDTRSKVIICDTNSGSLLAERLLDIGIPEIRMSPDGWRVAIKLDKRLLEWDLREDKLYEVWKSDEFLLSRAIYSRDGRFLFFGSLVDPMKTWHVDKHKIVCSAHNSNGTRSPHAVSPGGMLLCCGRYLWETSKLIPSAEGK